MTFSSLGKERRLSNLFTDGKTLVVPIDDSLIFGPKEGLFDLKTTVQNILSAGPNALLGFKRDMEYIVESGFRTPFIYNLTASTVLNNHTQKQVIADVENALTMGADCVAAHINISSQYEGEMLHNFAMISNECDRLGMPLLAIAYPRKEVNGKDYNYEDLKASDPLKYTELVAHCTRIVCELGADIIKTNYTGSAETFKSVVTAACGKPVIVAGGPKVPVEQSLQWAYNVIAAGGAGVSFGRNVFNSDHIGEYIKALKCIIFNGCSLDKAIKTFKNNVGE